MDCCTGKNLLKCKVERHFQDFTTFSAVFTTKLVDEQWYFKDFFTFGVVVIRYERKKEIYHPSHLPECCIFASPGYRYHRGKRWW